MKYNILLFILTVIVIIHSHIMVTATFESKYVYSITYFNLITTKLNLPILNGIVTNLTGTEL